MNTNAKPIYPCEQFAITETEFNLANNYRNETTFALSNGYIGTRGTFEEGYHFDSKTGLEGNFINGFYESEPIRYGEFGFGFPKNSQSMLNIMNPKIIRIYIEEEVFDMRQGVVEEYSRVLHMDKGTVVRKVVWTSPKGKKLQIETTRLVSFAEKHLVAMSYKATPLNFEGEVRIQSMIDCDVVNHTSDTNPLIDYGPYGKVLIMEEAASKGGNLSAKSRTEHTKLAVACFCRHILSKEGKVENKTSESGCEVNYTVFAGEKESIQLVKFITLADSTHTPEEDLDGILNKAMDFAVGTGFDRLAELQEEYMASFWEKADIQIQGDDALQQGIHFNLFHVMQSAGRDGVTGMAAKGLSGEGYEGHYFWDTEMYILPVFTHTFPELAKKLLDFRYSTLEQARERAKEMGHPKGALYPWRTINGTEASAYYPLGSAQYHINGDIAFAFWQYIQVTEDYEYLAAKACEVLCETARVWADVGSFAESKEGRYCICCVTGPDEYNALVDNNFYTNLCARENLRYALSALNLLREKKEEEYKALWEKLQLSEEEIEMWSRIIDQMYLPYDEKLGIYPQDDGFLQRKPWKEEEIPEEKRSLLYVNYHPLFVFRHKMSKQADAILGIYLHGNLFTLEEKKRNFDYYQTVTLHHSSLSTCIFGILACEIGYHELAYEYFSQSARMDLDDHHNNFYAGIHAANMAGTWLAIVNGFAGMRTNGGMLEFNPILPEQWKGYRFKVHYKNTVLEVEVAKEKTSYTLLEGAGLQFLHNKQAVVIKEKGGCCSFEQI